MHLPVHCGRNPIQGLEEFAEFPHVFGKADVAGDFRNIKICSFKQFAGDDVLLIFYKSCKIYSCLALEEKGKITVG